MKTLLKCRIQIAVDWLLRQITDCLISRPAQLCSCGTLINRSTLAYFPIPEVFINHFIDIFYEAVNCGFSKFFKKEKKNLNHSNNYKKIKYVWTQRKNVWPGVGVFTPTRAYSPRPKDWRAAYVPQKHLSCCRFLRVLISAPTPDR